MESILIWTVILAVLAFLLRNSFRKKTAAAKMRNYTIDDRYNAQKREREKEIDALLSKMGKNGIENLSPKDRKRLEELSKK